MTYKDALTGRLKMNEKMKARDLRNTAEGSKKLLIYSANMHMRSVLNPSNCTAKSSPRERATWITTMLPQLDRFPDTETWIQYAQAHMDVDFMDTKGKNGPAEKAGTSTTGASKQQQHAQSHQTAARGNTTANYA
jgi:hypothetical protein